MKDKKVYISPELYIHGDIEKLTQTGGALCTDVPQGTPNTGPGTVTGDVCLGS